MVTATSLFRIPLATCSPYSFMLLLEEPINLMFSEKKKIFKCSDDVHGKRPGGPGSSQQTHYTWFLLLPPSGLAVKTLEQSSRFPHVAQGQW